MLPFYYKGPGCADPKKTREDRERELELMDRTHKGREILEYLFGKYTGLLEGKVPALGLTPRQVILSREHPDA